MVTIIPVLTALVGLLMYLMTAHAKAQEVGRILFFCGVLVTLFGLGGQMVKLF